jgi:hypothetical protein
VTQAWTGTEEQDIARAEHLLLQVLEQDAGCALAHSAMGMVRRRRQNRLDEGRFEFETAIVLDPNDTYAAPLDTAQGLALLSELKYDDITTALQHYQGGELTAMASVAGAVMVFSLYVKALSMLAVKPGQKHQAS